WTRLTYCTPTVRRELFWGCDPGRVNRVSPIRRIVSAGPATPICEVFWCNRPSMFWDPSVLHRRCANGDFNWPAEEARVPSVGPSSRSAKAGSYAVQHVEKRQQVRTLPTRLDPNCRLCGGLT